MHEKLMHECNCTITLTYNDEHLPKDYSLNYQHYQAFMKKLRKQRNRDYNKYAAVQHSAKKIENLRFYMGGEYGDLYGRPHYHAALFGVDFNDKIYYKMSPAGFKLYTSETLTRLWGRGFAAVAELTFESAAYIARYIMKKRTGDGNKKYYEIINIETGEIQLRRKEFNQMSRRPGIGAKWLEKYEGDAYPQGKIVINGHEQNPPRYYDKIWAEKEPEKWEEIQYNRYKEGMKYITERTPERLKVQEQVQAARTKTLRRTLA